MAEISSLLSDLGWLRIDLLGRLVLAAVLGGVVGLEREWSGKPAGFRTNLLICVGAALITELSVTLSQRAAAGSPSDPARLAAQIVSGIGFLGAGTIIQSRGDIVGLTTAATLWVVAAIGIAVGAGAYVEAVGTTVLVIVSLVALRRVEPWLGHHQDLVVRVTLARSAEVVEAVEAQVSDGVEMELIEAERGEDTVTMAYRLSGNRKLLDPIVDRLLDVEGVKRVARG